MDQKRNKLTVNEMNPTNKILAGNAIITTTDKGNFYEKERETKENKMVRAKFAAAKISTKKLYHGIGLTNNEIELLSTHISYRGNAMVIPNQNPNETHGFFLNVLKSTINNFFCQLRAGTNRWRSLTKGYPKGLARTLFFKQHSIQ